MQLRVRKNKRKKTGAARTKEKSIWEASEENNFRISHANYTKVSCPFSGGLCGHYCAICFSEIFFFVPSSGSDFSAHKLYHDNLSEYFKPPLAHDGIEQRPLLLLSHSLYFFSPTTAQCLS
jgi:hypothetical protein